MKTALISGASSGLGRALAEELARDGFRVVLVARRSLELHALAHAIEAEGGVASVLVLDVSASDAAEQIAAIDRETPLDLVIANAGVGPPSGAESWAWSTIAAPFHVNFCGAAATLTGALEAMVKRGRGHLVGISSLSSYGALPGSAAYCAPKAGLNMLLDCLRLDLAPHGIAVTTVYMGFVDTRMVAHRDGAMPQLMSADKAARHIVRRLRKRPATMAFPTSLALGARLAAAIPRVLRDRIVGLLDSRLHWY